jgi:hypothetical protein
MSTRNRKKYVSGEYKHATLNILPEYIKKYFSTYSVLLKIYGNKLVTLSPSLCSDKLNDSSYKI